MTRKETLLEKKYELQNQIHALRGEELEDVEAYKSNGYFHREAQQATQNGLERDIEHLEKALETAKAEAERQRATEAFYATDAGQMYRAAIEKKLEEQKEQFKQGQYKMLESMNEWIKGTLGDHWGVKSLSENCITFAVINPEKPDDFIFAQSIDVYYEKSSWLDDGRPRFETNIGTTGSFNLLDQEVGNRARYYMDLGRFLSETAKLEGLKYQLFRYADKCRARRIEIKNTSERLENPLAL